MPSSSRSFPTAGWLRSSSGTRKFGDDTAGQLSELLDGLTGLDNIDRVTDALLECGTGEEFIERMQMA